MKKFSWTVLGLFLVLLSACSSADGEEGEAAQADSEGGGEIQEVKAKLAHSYPVGLFASKGYEHFAELANEKSDGKIEIEIYPSGQLYLDTAMPNAVSSGQIEMGVNTMEMWSSQLPLADFSTLPVFDDYAHVHRSFENGLAEVFEKELGNFGVKPLLWTDSGFAYFASTDEPLLKPEDFEGMRVRTTSPTMSRFVELVGGTPVSISSAETAQALQRGTIDAAVSSVAGFQAMQYFEYSNRYSGKFNAGIVLLSVNQKWWDGLNEETQDVLLEAAAEAQDWIAKEQEAVYADATAALEGEGMTGHEIDRAAFESVFAELKAGFIKEAGPVGEEVLKIIEDNR